MDSKIIILLLSVLGFLGFFIWSYYSLRKSGLEKGELDSIKNAIRQEDIQLKAYESKLQEINKQIIIPNNPTSISAIDASHVLSGEIPDSTQGPQT